MGALEHDEGEDEEFEADDGNAGAGAYDMDED